MKINMKFLPLKAHYFSFFGAGGPFVPYIPIIAKQLGLSAVAVGLLFTVIPVLGTIGKPLMGAVADRYQCQRGLYIASVFIGVCSFLVIPWIPKIQQDSVVDLVGTNETFIRICSEVQTDRCGSDKSASWANFTHSTCKLHCLMSPQKMEYICDSWNDEPYCFNSTTENAIDGLRFHTQLRPTDVEREEGCLMVKIHKMLLNHTEWKSPLTTGNETFTCSAKCDEGWMSEVLPQPKLDDEELPYIYQFWLFFIFIVIGRTAMHIGVSLSDAICFNILDDKKAEYGKQRVWGSVGWGIFSVIAGLLVDWVSRGKMAKDFTPNYVLMACIFTFNIYIATKLKANKTKQSSNIFKDVGGLFKDVKICIFMLWITFNGICTALVWNFLLWYMEDLADAQGCETRALLQTMQGLAMGVQCFLGELPFFFLSGWFLKKLGHIHTMSLVLFCFGIKFLLYSIATSPWHILPIETMCGLTFSVFYATMTSYASIVSPPGTEATMQGIVGAVFEGVGSSIGSLIGGILLNKMSGARVFFGFGVLCFIACALHILAYWSLEKKNETVEKGYPGVKYMPPGLHPTDKTAKAVII
jgi:MFS family permease